MIEYLNNWITALDKRFDKVKCSSIVIGTGLLSVCAIILLLTSLLFFLGQSICNLIFPISILITAFPIWYLSKKEKSSWWRNCILIYFIIFISLFISSIAYDHTYDGLTYHQDMIYQLKNGWNPVYAHHADGAHPKLVTWVSHYARGIEIISATIYAFTNNIESGKAVNFMLVIASFCFINHYFRHAWGNLKPPKRFYYVFILTLCPVVVAQGLTYYVDWCLYSLLMILVSVLLSLNKEIKLNSQITICIVLILAVFTKFNSAFWMYFVILCYFLYLLFRKKYAMARTLALISFISLLVGCCVIGYNPYITNFIDHAHPLYPLMGEGAIHAMPQSMPANMVGNIAIKNIFVSFFAHTVHPGLGTTPVQLYYPFTFTKYDLIVCGVADLRVSGFGLFFNVILILSLLLYSLCKLTRKDRFVSLVILLGLFVSLFILPFGWWARFIPFFYLFPFVILLYSEQCQLSVLLIRLRQMIYAITMINILLVIASSLLISYGKHKQVDEVLDKLSYQKELRINTGINIGFKIKLEETGINYINTKDTIGLSFRCFHPPVFINLSKE